MGLLDFVIIGAEKSGTTLLVEILRRTAGVFLPDREIRFFRDPFFPAREKPEDYFSADVARHLKGIKHPSYLGRPEVPPRILEHSPHAKLIAILRDPIKRTIASYLHYVRQGQIPCIEPNVGIPLMVTTPSLAPKYRDIIEFGHYAKHLKAFLQIFPRDQLLILEFEDFIRTPQTVERLFNYLAVEPPPNLWPLPRINEGSYDWTECCRQHRQSRSKFEYDEQDNIISVRKPDTTEEPHLAPTTGSSKLSREALNVLAAHYKDEAAQLADMGLLVPKCWTFS